MKKIFSLILILFSLLLIGCQPDAAPQEQETTTEQAPDATWLNINLADINSGETFTLGQFDKPVLVESFAVWCPLCLKQQQEIERLHEMVGDSVVSVALNTDPNEDETAVQDHINEHQFEWRFAISPPELTQPLIDQFSIGVVNAPAAPVILICEDDSARLLPRGVKTAEDLLQEVEKGC